MAEEKNPRKKYSATPVSKIKEQESIAVKPIYTNDDGGERLPYHKIEEGKNKFRIFPAHEDDSTFTHQKAVIFLNIPIETEENGKKKIEVKKKPVFNARVHGNFEKDIVEEYVNFTSKTLRDEIDDESVLKERLTTLHGDFATRKEGLRYNFNHICYANKITVVEEVDAKGKPVLKADGSPKKVNKKTFGFWDFSSTIQKQLNKMNIEDDDPDAEISTDPFTDPDTGKFVTIEYKKEAAPADKYSAALQTNGVSPLTDDELEMFDKVDSLTKLFSNVYKRRDFDLALAGLQLFDRKNGFRTFENDDFLEIIENLRAEIPSEEEEKKQQAQTTSKTTNVSKAKKSEKEPLFDEFDDMDRDALKRYIAKNKEELGVITIKTIFSDDQIRELIREKKKELAALEEVEEEEEEIIEEEVEEEIETETEEEEEVEEQNVTKSSTRDKYKTPAKEKEASDDEVLFGRDLTPEDFKHREKEETPKTEGASKSKLQELRDKKAKK